MSDGLARVAGAHAIITLKGRDYQVRQITFGDFAAIEQHLIKRQGNLIERLGSSLKGLDPEVRREFIQAAVEQMDARPSVSPEESAQFLNSFEGVVYAFWLLMKTQHAELESPRQVEELMSDMPLDALFDTFNRVSGLAPLKNSIGPAPESASRAELTGLATVATGATKLEMLAGMPDPHESRGPSSIAG